MPIPSQRQTTSPTQAAERKPVRRLNDAYPVRGPLLSECCPTFAVHLLAGLADAEDGETLGLAWDDAMEAA